MQNCEDLSDWKRRLQLDIDILIRIKILPPIISVKLDDAIVGRDDGAQFTAFKEMDGGQINQTVTAGWRVITIRYNDQSNGWDAFFAIWGVSRTLRIITKIDYQDCDDSQQGQVTIAFAEPKR